ncbi:MAG: hypothetical protein H0T79_16140, partial [Deltaproteobacteria bacterium]|nr:hypothetical protein [Deltaproteobacteria bacterium]
MRISSHVLSSVFWLSAVAAVGCKGKPTKQEPPPTAAKVGSGSAGSGSAVVDSKPPAPEATRIPVRTNTPPNKTTAPLTEAKLKELAAKQFDTF